VRLNRSSLFERRASAALFNVEKLRNALALSWGLACACVVLALVGYWIAACAAAVGAVLCARYLFFVSVVPLNMALTFVRGGER